MIWADKKTAAPPARRECTIKGNPIFYWIAFFEFIQFDFGIIWLMRFRGNVDYHSPNTEKTTCCFCFQRGRISEPFTFLHKSTVRIRPAMLIFSFLANLQENHIEAKIDAEIYHDLLPQEIPRPPEWTSESRYSPADKACIETENLTTNRSFPSESECVCSAVRWQLFVPKSVLSYDEPHRCLRRLLASVHRTVGTGRKPH